MIILSPLASWQPLVVQHPPQLPPPATSSSSSASSILDFFRRSIEIENPASLAIATTASLSAADLIFY